MPIPAQTSTGTGGSNSKFSRVPAPGGSLFDSASSSTDFRPLLPSLLDHPGPTAPTLARHLHALPPTPATELPSSESSAHGDDDDDDDEADVPPLSNLANIKLRDGDGNAHVHAFAQDEDDGMNKDHTEDHRLLYAGAGTTTTATGLSPFHQPLPPSRPRNIAVNSTTAGTAGGVGISDGHGNSNAISPPPSFIGATHVPYETASKSIRDAVSKLVERQNANMNTNTTTGSGINTTKSNPVSSSIPTMPSSDRRVTTSSTTGRSSAHGHDRAGVNKPVHGPMLTSTTHKAELAEDEEFVHTNYNNRNNNSTLNNSKNNIAHKPQPPTPFAYTNDIVDDENPTDMDADDENENGHGIVRRTIQQIQQRQLQEQQQQNAHKLGSSGTRKPRERPATPMYLQPQATSGVMNNSNNDENSNVYMDDQEPDVRFVNAVDDHDLDLDRVHHKSGANRLALGISVDDDDGGYGSVDMCVDGATDSDREKFDDEALARQTEAANRARRNNNSSSVNPKRAGPSSSSGHQRRHQRRPSSSSSSRRRMNDGEGTAPGDMDQSTDDDEFYDYGMSAHGASKPSSSYESHRSATGTGSTSASAAAAAGSSSGSTMRISSSNNNNNNSKSRSRRNKDKDRETSKSSEIKSSASTEGRSSKSRGRKGGSSGGSRDRDRDKDREGGRDRDKDRDRDRNDRSDRRRASSDHSSKDRSRRKNGNGRGRDRHRDSKERDNGRMFGGGGGSDGEIDRDNDRPATRENGRRERKRTNKGRGLGGRKDSRDRGRGNQTEDDNQDYDEHQQHQSATAAAAEKHKVLRSIYRHREPESTDSAPENPIPWYCEGQSEPEDTDLDDIAQQRFSGDSDFGGGGGERDHHHQYGHHGHDDDYAGGSNRRRYDNYGGRDSGMLVMMEDVHQRGNAADNEQQERERERERRPRRRYRGCHQGGDDSSDGGNRAAAIASSSSMVMKRRAYSSYGKRDKLGRRQRAQHNRTVTFLYNN